MATETLVPDGIASAGSWSGAATDIDEGVPGDSVAAITTTTDNDVIDLNLSASAVVDADTVTDITVNISALTTGSSGKDTLTVDLLVGGTGLGTFVTAHLTGSYVTYACTNALWNVDRTATEMAGLQLRITATQTGKATAATWDVDSADVVVTYTEAGGGLSIPIIMHNRLIQAG
jgi:hypothetical protein